MRQRSQKVLQDLHQCQVVGQHPYRCHVVGASHFWPNLSSRFKSLIQLQSVMGAAYGQGEQAEHRLLPLHLSLSASRIYLPACLSSFLIEVFLSLSLLSVCLPHTHTHARRDGMVPVEHVVSIRKRGKCQAFAALRVRPAATRLAQLTGGPNVCNGAFSN